MDERDRPSVSSLEHSASAERISVEEIEADVSRSLPRRRCRVLSARSLE